MKTFRGDLIKFQDKLKNHETFALSRVNDGETDMLLGYAYSTKKHNHKIWFEYDPNDENNKSQGEKLLDSAKYRGSDYYVGIACKCCVGSIKNDKLKLLIEQDEEHLTWGNIFIHSNYDYFIENVVPLFSDYDVIMVVNENSKTDNLIFNNKINKIFTIGINAWVENFNLINDIKSYIIDNNIKNKLFIFAAGPFSNILIHECYLTSTENTYIDIGSALDVQLELGMTRGYLHGESFYRKKVCIW